MHRLQNSKGTKNKTIMIIKFLYFLEFQNGWEVIVVGEGVDGEYIHKSFPTSLFFLTPIYEPNLIFKNHTHSNSCVYIILGQFYTNATNRIIFKHNFKIS